ncbi:thiolase domain-containing protein [Halalkalicoccus sp. NIPERK01]|uniref:thiolase domain-containing protein n=1 Tax=Halalkalicoccus sp. NIPERK01 TaxID=3053469 RepID=UPI00256EA8BE|nr:thiolase domain-containing protein [Halalkalicoccus sp. NIPERK01]MDL5363814.1 thiolase domain-containing protein [Halalkalicoccus sp. NIPERK01]
MRDVAIVGRGTTTYGVHDDGIKDLATKAVARALDSSGLERSAVEALSLGNFAAGMLEGQELLAALVADAVGLEDIPVMKTEGACASSGIAFHQARQQIAMGVHDVVVVVGVEKMTGVPTAEFTQALAAAADGTTEGQTGLTFPGFYGLFTSRYLHEYSVDREDISKVAVKNRRNAAENPRARFREPITIDDVMESEPIADPLRLYDCCPAADGATAVVLTASDMAPSVTSDPIEVLATAHTSGRSGAYRYDDLTTFEATRTAASRVYSEADVTPADIDVVELHDCFSSAEVGDSEDLRFFPKGEGAAAAAAGDTAVDGEIPINPSGGLLSKGHPVGATGLGQIYEICRQLNGDHENQVADAQTGLTHNLGGSGAVCTVSVLGRK